MALASLGRLRARASTLAIITGLAFFAGAQMPALAPAFAESTSSSASFDRGYADLVARVLPAVVNVSVEKTEVAEARGQQVDPNMQRFFERFFGQPMPTPDAEPRSQRQRGEGSGVIIDASGHIVTNAHVAGGATKVTVSFQDGSTLPAKIVGVDEKTDLAVLKVEAGRKLPFVGWGDSAGVRVGDKVLAVGNPFGLGGTVTEGIVSATKRELGAGPYDDFLQVDAAINRGNSGGPTFNLDGQVIGINSVIYSPSGGNVGIGFAIAANLAREVTTELMESGKVTRGWLGVGIQQVTPDIAQSLGIEEAKGAIVTSVEPEGPAAKAGLKTGDVIREFGGKQIERVRDLTRAVAEVAPGKGEPVEVWRDGGRRTISVAVGQMPSGDNEVAANEPAAEDQPRLGLTLADITPELRRQLEMPAEVSGVLVRGVEPGSPAEEKGLTAGDVILRVGNKPVTSAADLSRLVKAAHERGEKSVLMLFQRDGAQLFAAIPFAIS